MSEFEIRYFEPIILSGGSLRKPRFLFDTFDFLKKEQINEYFSKSKKVTSSRFALLDEGNKIDVAFVKTRGFLRKEKVYISVDCCGFRRSLRIKARHSRKYINSWINAAIRSPNNEDGTR